METGSKQQVYQEMRALLNEKQWRHYLAMEAQQRGSVAEVAKEASVSRNTVKRGLHEWEAGELYRLGEPLRQAGGGRKKAVERDATLQADLASLLDPKGDPMSLVQWTTRSLAQLVKALEALGHQIKKSALAEGTSRTMEQSGKQKGKRRKSMSMTFCPSHQAKRSPMGSTIWSITRGLSMSVLTMIQLNLRSRAFGNGGSCWEEDSILRKRNCSLLPMEAGLMG